MMYSEVLFKNRIGIEQFVFQFRLAVKLFEIRHHKIFFSSNTISKDFVEGFGYSG